MYIRYPYVVKNERGEYLQEESTFASFFWGNQDTAMHILHYIGAITIQEVAGGFVYQLNRDRQELNYVSL